MMLLITIFLALATTIKSNVILEPQGSLVAATGYAHMGMPLHFATYNHIKSAIRSAIRNADKRVNAHEYEKEVLRHIVDDVDRSLSNVEHLMRQATMKRSFILSLASLGLSIFNTVEIVAINKAIANEARNTEMIAHRLDDMVAHVNGNIVAVRQLNRTLYAATNAVVKLQQEVGDGEYMANLQVLVELYAREVENLERGVDQLLESRLLWPLRPRQHRQKSLEGVNKRITAKGYFPIVTSLRHMRDVDTSYILMEGGFQIILHIPYSRMAPLELFHVRPLPFMVKDKVLILQPEEQVVARSESEGTFYSIPNDLTKKCRLIQTNLVCQMAVLHTTASSCFQRITVNGPLNHCPLREVHEESAYQLNNTNFMVFSPNITHFKFHCVSHYKHVVKVQGLSNINVPESCVARSEGLTLVPSDSFWVNASIVFEPDYNLTFPNSSEVSPLLTTWPGPLSLIQTDQIQSHLHHGSNLIVTILCIIFVCVIILMACVIAGYFLKRFRTSNTYETVTPPPPNNSPNHSPVGSES